MIWSLVTTVAMVLVAVATLLLAHQQRGYRRDLALVTTATLTDVRCKSCKHRRYFGIDGAAGMCANPECPSPRRDLDEERRAA